MPWGWFGKFDDDSGVVDGVVGAIGNTPLIYLKGLSKKHGCHIYGKAEFLNPGGSVKDRVALQIINDAEQSGKISKGDTLYEGTAGSTGISLAMISSAKGYACEIFMPNDQAIEKSLLMEQYGATVHRVPPVSIVDSQQFTRLAEQRAKEKGGFYTNQFENLSNFRAHYNMTGPEIVKQMVGKCWDGFVAAAGTGGTIAGISEYLRDTMGAACPRIALVDPQGSSLYNRVEHGVAFSVKEREGTRTKNQIDSITEGIGIVGRITANFAKAEIDQAFQCSDQEAVDMARVLMREEGLFLGSSSAVNCVGAVKLAKVLGEGSTIVTILCDGGHRHLSRFYNRAILEERGLK